MRAVIFAAGKGTRLRPLTYKTPKPMLKIKNRPILEYTIGALPEEVDEVIIVIGYLGHIIKNHFGIRDNGRKIRYVVQKELNGTAGALWYCKKYLSGKFLVLAGDDLYHPKDLKKLVKQELAILAHRVKNASRFGVLKMNKNKNLKGFMEKPKNAKNKLVNTAVYTLDERIFKYDLIESKIYTGEFLLPQLIFKMAKDFPVKIVNAFMWHPIGYQKDIKKAEKIIHKFKK